MVNMTSSDEQHHRLEVIAEGREAVALMGALRPYIDSRVMHLVHLMAARYRAGTAEFPFLLGAAAQITCMMDLLSDLDNRARRGDIAMTKEMRDAP